jgi:MFS family permease
MSQNETLSRRSAALPTKIAFGWSLSLLAQTIVLLMMVVHSVITEVSTNFRSLKGDPGRAGLVMITYMVAFYLLMPLYVFFVDKYKSRALRWIAVGAAVFAFLFQLLHHLSHVYFGQRATFTSNVMDLVIHTVGIWVIVNSIRWVKAVAPAAERETLPEGVVTAS